MSTNPSPLVVVPFQNHSNEGLLVMSLGQEQKGNLPDDDKDEY